MHIRLSAPAPCTHDKSSASPSVPGPCCPLAHPGGNVLPSAANNEVMEAVPQPKAGIAVPPISARPHVCECTHTHTHTDRQTTWIESHKEPATHTRVHPASTPCTHKTSNDRRVRRVPLTLVNISKGAGRRPPVNHTQFLKGTPTP
jgi:hypothetical protein